MNPVLTKSEHFTEEYCCSIVRVGALKGIENSDHLAETKVNGETIIVNKDEVKEGDIMLYISNECKIAYWFLSSNNMYEDYTLNSNNEEVKRKLTENPNFKSTDEYKKMKGYFNKYGRVRMITLRGVNSFGVLLKPSSLEYAASIMGCKLGVDWEKEVGNDFDTVCGTEFVSVYIPPIKKPRNSGTGLKKKENHFYRFKRVIDGQLRFHYDTGLLKKNLDVFTEDSHITATVKLHGTSFICGNLVVNHPKKWFKARRWCNHYLHTNFEEVYPDYGMVCSSRRVIGNEYGNSKYPDGYYGGNFPSIYKEYAEWIYPAIPKNVTIYGEICGYKTGESTFIQKNYDYGCMTGTNFLMIYRATEHLPDDTYKEYSIEEIIHLTYAMKLKLPERNKMMLCNISYIIVYTGTIKYLMSMEEEKDVARNDMERLPEALAHLCKIEQHEPMCISKVPREGIVVRIRGDKPRAFKLKSTNFLKNESKMVDKGEVDMEMANSQ